MHDAAIPVRRRTRVRIDPFPVRAWFVPWPDEVLDRRGHDPRAEYVELFWLGVLGPSPTWLARRVAMRFDRDPNGFEADCAALAGELGLAAGKGWSSTFGRTVERCVMFGVARPLDDDVPGWAFRRRMPTVTARQLARLPERIRDLHAGWYRNELERARSPLSA